MSRVENTVTIEGARLIFKNFTGREGQYNREGDRNFGLLLPDDIANDMAKDGWNIKWLTAREEGEQDQAWLPVSVGYGKGRPPTIVMISSRGRNHIGEDEAEMLDWVDMKIVDLIVRPYNYEVNGKIGVKAYLKSMFVTINEDELELKYSAMEREGRDD